jgi:hypothetical protein
VPLPGSRYLRVNALRRGVLGDSRPWFWFAVVSYSFRALRRLLGRTEKVLYREELRPGQTLVIAHDREPEIVRAPD